MFPIKNCHAIHGISTVPTPNTGKMSTTEINADNITKFSILNPIAFNIENAILKKYY